MKAYIVTNNRRAPQANGQMELPRTFVARLSKRPLTFKVAAATGQAVATMISNGRRVAAHRTQSHRAKLCDEL